ncbi:RidA family protein [Xanthobacter tagetidis]|jgi:enamine deaminase RidA (YjgF/YER057c/UK114 family)|uniref:RidA family protein n=1 Tax=Xanthobacter tagetidis TaxID=60216 RepID=A0A3L7AAI8_9HYPH|nr:RidA family protein [Xanthobacter tagetidis]MBB6309664.1 enamine deaminase RidA (YjgF/YER057c/UK114 family) [Xanthobacter tagetidis]RLP77207.1 RidA family protein [Xanthobacter tagetidis]
MSTTIEQKLASLGITLPTPTPPLANYVPVVRTGNLLFVSGQVSIDGAGTITTGKLGGGLSIEAGQAAARLCAINILAQVKASVGDLEKVVRVVKLVAFVNSVPDFTDQPKVVNGCSDLLVEILGDKGRHARSAVGIAALPFNAAVEVEAVVEVA